MSEASMKEASDPGDSSRPPSAFDATMPAGTLARNVVEAIERGHKIEAIKLVREQTGMGLKESKDLVDAYEAAHPRPHGHAHVRPGAASPGEVRDGTSRLWWIVATLVALLLYYFVR
jgi:hypothetical protein